MNRFHQSILKQLMLQTFKSHQQLSKSIRTLSGQFKIAPPKKSDLIKVYHSLVKNGSIKPNLAFFRLLKKREVRTISGVAPIAVLTKPYPCPGRCAFCPTEVRMPKSYLSNEPAVMRAVMNKWDPYKQVSMRLRALKMNGHGTDKCELIVIGGTWSFLPKKYQQWFIKRLFDALNGSTSRTLAEAQKKNESAKNRAVGLCLETRPDYITAEEVKWMRQLGCTRVEIGVQSTDDKVLKLNKRGHTTASVVRATKLLRDAGFKITYHLMPNLPGATPKSDIQTAKDVFQKSDFQPDMVKIYPCVVVKNAEIYQWWKKGLYHPYSEKKLFDTLLAIKKEIPPYCRVTRLIRDIPTTSIVAGNMISNLRQEVLITLKNQGTPCQCIRCREPKNEEVEIKDVIRVCRTYAAGHGTEYFLSLENKTHSKIYAFVRLRLPKILTPKMIEALPILQGAAVIRELHTYGILTPLDANDGNVQHRGFGKQLMAWAEERAKESGYKKIAVIAGIGVRKYYRKLGYRLDQTYMVKKLSK